MLESPESTYLELASAGLGAGSKSVIEDWIATQFPTFPTQYAGIVAGFLLYYYGERLHHYLRMFGAGVLIGSIGQLDIVKGFFSGLAPHSSGGSPSNKAAQAPAQTVGDLAKMESQRTVSRGVI